MSTTTISDGGLVTYSIKVNGSLISADAQVMSINIKKAVNKISSASITLLDGEVSSETFELSSSSTFVPGNNITIEAGYDSQNEVIFQGIVTQQSIQVNREVGSVLIVTCKDEAVKMTVGRKSASYAQKTDSDILSSIIGNYSGLSADVTATQTTWPEQVQYYTTDWDFIRSRAETNGMIVTTHNGTVAVFPPDRNTSSVLEIEYGNNLLSFNAALHSVNQIQSAKASSWDFQTQHIITGEAQTTYAGPGNLSTKALSEVVGLKEYELQTSANLQASDLTQWSKAEIIKSEYAKIQGEVSFQGSNLVEPSYYITLAGLGDRFNGDHFVSEVNHIISHGNWTTEVSLGMSPAWMTTEDEVMAPPAAGLLPGVQGLYNGTVKQIDQDPENQYRILVDIPLFDVSGEGIWTRLSNFYATSGAGAFFLPERGDEVVVGFLNQDPRFPIILGSLYSSTNNQPYEGLTPNEQNSKKAIVSKKGMYVEFDDENVVFTINTPNKNQLVFSDQDKSIRIQDQNGNSIAMSESGITLKSDKDINIESSQSLTLKGDTGVTIEASRGDVSIKGMNIKQLADMEFSAEGSATASLQGGTQTTIKGAMVMIN
jgi:Rhs element Vgr protein